MKIVIDIPDMKDTDDYFMLGQFRMPNDGQKYGEVVTNAIKNGTPLPKGHGRLIDADDLTWARHTVDKYGYEEDTVVSWDDIVDAPTIIEADKSESEGRE